MAAVGTTGPAVAAAGGPLGLQWRPRGHPRCIKAWQPIKFRHTLMLGFPHMIAWFALLVVLRYWLACVAAWFALLVGLRCWLVCVAGWFSSLVDLCCWLVCVAGWFALRVGLHCGLVCIAG